LNASTAYKMNNNLAFRLALESDLPAIVEMLADDHLGSTREKFESPLPEAYTKAFENISKDHNQELTVAEINGEVVGTFQLSYIYGLSLQGALRMQVEAVRVSSKYRGEGLGTKFFEYIIKRAKEKGCRVIQLASNKQRPDAIRFYEKLGFTASHEGMKLSL
jgi:GNAT superfamily N-acetyltransferase